MKQKIFKATAILLMAVLAFAFAACGSGETSAPAMESSNANDDSVVVETEVPAAVEDAVAEGEADMGVAGDTAEEISADSAVNEGVGLPDANRKITFSASYSLETKSYDKDYAQINRLVTEAGGYIANEETIAYPYEFESTQGRNSYFTLKIPVGKYDSFLDNIAKIGEVANKTKSSEDLTSEYFDTEARIEMLQMRKDRLTGYIRGATKASDIVEFERELSDVLLELDRYEGNKRRLDQLVDYATVNVTLNEMITPETIGKDGQPLGDRASDAFRMSATGVGEFLRDAAVFFSGAAPVVALIVVIIVIIWLIVKYVRRARAKYYEAHPEKKKARQVYNTVHAPYASYAAPQSQQQPVSQQPAPQSPQQEPQPQQERQSGNTENEEDKDKVK
jgi:hypothetical protein